MLVRMSAGYWQHRALMALVWVLEGDLDQTNFRTLITCGRGVLITLQTEKCGV